VKHYYFFILIVLTAFSAFCSDENSSAYARVEGVFRINTDISAGEKSLAEIAKKAKRANMDFLVVSDQFLVRCEYGIPPFRNLLKLSKERPSVRKYGIENYLELIEKVEENDKSLILIKGIDVAPHYRWRRNTSDSKLECRQFSQQLTLFGDLDGDFLCGLPVIHNSSWERNPLSILKKLYPLILIIPGLLLMRRKVIYDDAQGNKYYGASSKIRKIIAFAIFAVSIIWTVDNRPFISDPGFDPYSDYGRLPFQKLIDHVKAVKGDKVGVSWSSPEARSAVEISGVRLVTEKYHDMITDSFNYDGFAGIYGDARTAHLPGREWDIALRQYCDGKRNSPPFIFGELDYHKDYENIPFDYIKTVVLMEKTKEKNSKNISSAMIDGNCYAVAKSGENEIVLDNFSVLCQDGNSASSGGTVLVREEQEVKLLIEGFIAGKTANRSSAKLRIILNGEELVSKKISERKFLLEMPLPKDKLGKMNFVRLIIVSEQAGELLSNPIFIRR